MEDLVCRHCSKSDNCKYIKDDSLNKLDCLKYEDSRFGEDYSLNDIDDTED